ncbi:MAG: hypothetical protein WA989_11415 [Henriciella sp.]|uniref:hypothetical protein n=1 Tax=Henriciella sp. TaxID=1968823 RepID=UPI003C77DD53
MTDTIEPKRVVVSLAVGVLTIAAAILAFGVAKKTGMLDPDLARRGVAIMLGLMLVVTGNYVPKLRLFQASGGQAGTSAVDRFAGWTFVLSGIAFITTWVFAPIGSAMLASPMIGAAGFLLVLARWIAWGDRSGASTNGSALPKVTPARAAIFMLLASLLWTFAIFFADTIWGDSVAQWMAMGFVIALCAVSPFLVAAIRRTGGRA